MKKTNGRFALPLADGRYYDSLRHEVVTSVTLGDRLLLDGQEEEVIKEVLLTQRTTGIDVVPSWECNLRCPHCYVAQHLKKPSGSTVGDVDPEKLLRFVECIKPMTCLTRLYFVGGEPLLHPDLFRHLSGCGVPMHVTTNGYWDFDKIEDVLRAFELIVFSIDGLPEDHNVIRRALDHNQSPFRVTYRNLRRSVKELKAEVLVQGSSVHREYSLDDKARYVALMILAGVKGDNVRLAPAASTEKHGGGIGFDPSRVIRTKPCCDFQAGFHLIVNGNHVYHSYYMIGDRAPEGLPIGHLDDDPAEVLDNYRRRILAHAPILRDKVCMTKCKAVGVCWGGCSNVRREMLLGKPSTICDRVFKEAKVLDLANGSLVREVSCRP
jgi:sulfatase maturation enzyme AslB (radical SAM superfamily)